MLKLFLFITSILFSFSSAAKQAPVKWNELIDNSELVAYVKIKSSEDLGEGKGVTRAKILSVLKGDEKKKELSIEWQSSIYDNTPTKINSNFVIFVKKTQSDKYTATVSSRSFWEFKDCHASYNLDECSVLTFSSYFLSNIPEELYFIDTIPARNRYSNGIDVKVVDKSLLFEYFNN